MTGRWRSWEVLENLVPRCSDHCPPRMIRGKDKAFVKWQSQLVGKWDLVSQLFQSHLMHKMGRTWKQTQWALLEHLVHVRHCAKCFTSITLFTSQQPWWFGQHYTSYFTREEMEAQGCVVTGPKANSGKWKSGNRKPGGLGHGAGAWYSPWERLCCMVSNPPHFYLLQKGWTLNSLALLFSLPLKG